MEIYLDNAATTQCYSEVTDLMVNIMRGDYGNPSSMHRMGVRAEQYLRGARETIASLLKVSEKDIYFTSGGTESNNWALFGAADALKRKGNHIITSSIEHAAVLSPAAALAERGFRLTTLPVDAEGRVSLQDLREALTPDTVLVSVMYVNNEIGTEQDIGSIGALIRECVPQALFHVDAVQAFGKIRILPKRLKIDMMSVSGHKIHGPKGAGFLYLGERAKIHPLILGGGQQNGMRSGTDNVPGAAGLAKAAEMVCGKMEENAAHMTELREQLREGIAAIPGTVIHTPLTGTAPHILNASFTGIRSEVLLHALEDRGIYVSAGSACSSHKRAGSAVLKAIGCTKEEMDSALRFSLSEQTSEEEISCTINVLNEIIPSLRKYTRR